MIRQAPHCATIPMLVLALALLTTAAQAVEPVYSDFVIEGNNKTDRSVVTRIIGLEPGDPFPLEAFDAVWDRLEDCGYFAFVDLDSEEDDEGNVTLLVTVEEEATFRPTPYLRYDRRHKYLLGAAITDTNLRGKGERLDLQAIFLYIQRARATWTKPWFLGADGLELQLDAFWEQAPFVYRPFDYDQWWATADLTQTVTGPLFVTAGGGWEHFSQRDDYRWQEGFGPDAAPAPYAAGDRDTWLLRAGLGLDTRDNPFYPGRGFYATYRFSYRTGGDLDGLSSHAVDLSAFVPLPGEPILALHARGAKADIEHTEHVLRWGGPETVRGAPYAGREGEYAYLASAEVRWPLFMMPVSVTGEQVGLGLHAFTDVGDAYYDPGDDLANPRALFSFGGGVHVNLLTWQLRFEAAKERDHDWTFEFLDVFNF